MSLPIAQLGYMPGINAPSHVPNGPQVRNPWEDLAMQVLASVAGQAVGNVMQRDYATQATAESPEQITAGPMTDPSTGQTFGGQTPLGPQNAGFISKMFQGPTMGAQQYGQVQQRQAGQQEARAERSFKKTENAADRASAEQRDKARLEQSGQQFNQSIGLDRDRLELQKQGQASDTLFKGGALEVDRQNAATRANPAADPDTMTRVIGQMASELHKTMMETWSRQAAVAQATGQPPPPMPSYNDAVRQAATAAQQFLGVQRAPTPTAPSVPLLQ